jgi:hypothetical protein
MAKVFCLITASSMQNGLNDIQDAQKPEGSILMWRPTFGIIIRTT